MRLLTPTLALFALLSASAADAKSHVKIKLTVPTLVQCETTTLHWKGGKPPFRVYVDRYHSPDDSWAQSDSRTPEGISSIVENGTEYSAPWLVDAPAGSRVKVRLVDAIGHWTNSYSVVHIGSRDDCLNPDYPDPTAEPSHPPPVEWALGGHAVLIGLGVVILAACVFIAWGIGRTEKPKKEESGYLPVSGDDIQLSQLGGRATRRKTPTHIDEEGEEEHHSLLPRNGTRVI